MVLDWGQGRSSATGCSGWGIMGDGGRMHFRALHKFKTLSRGDNEWELSPLLHTIKRNLPPLGQDYPGTFMPIVLELVFVNIVSE